MTTAIAELLDFDPEITSQIKRMLERSHFIYNWSSFMIALVCESETLKFEDENGILIDIPPSILDKLSVLKRYTDIGNGVWVTPRNSSCADLLKWCNKDQRRILVPETIMTGHFVFDELLAYILHFDMNIKLDDDCCFKRLLRSHNIHDCHAFTRAIANAQYKEWEIADTLLSHLVRYHQYIYDHGTDAFCNYWIWYRAQHHPTFVSLPAREEWVKFESQSLQQFLDV